METKPMLYPERRRPSPPNKGKRRTTALTPEELELTCDVPPDDSREDVIERVQRVFPGWVPDLLRDASLEEIICFLNEQLEYQQKRATNIYIKSRQRKVALKQLQRAYENLLRKYERQEAKIKDLNVALRDSSVECAQWRRLHMLAEKTGYRSGTDA